MTKDRTHGERHQSDFSIDALLADFPEIQRRRGSIHEMSERTETMGAIQDHDISARADRIYDACMRAVKVLKFNREPRSDMPGRYVQAALREVEELRASQRRSENADVDSDSVTLYRDGMERPEKAQWDAVFGKRIRSTDSKGAIDRLLMLAHWLRCNCVFPLKLTVPWHEEPHWIELGKQTRRLFNAVSGAL